jgi:hypothetical protein
MARKKTYQNLYVGLTSVEHERLRALAEIDGKTKTELGREALTWYLDRRENEENLERDSVYARSIKEMTNRICGMLARQGTALGVLYDLAWHSLEDEKSRQFFDEILKEVKSKQRKRLEADEKVLAAKMKGIVTGGQAI